MQPLARVLAIALLATTASAAYAAKIAVIGTGNVGAALGPEFAALGHTIVYGSRTPNDQDVKDLVAKTGHGATATTQPEAVKGADMVLLAVPGNLAEQITRSLGDLSGKIIIDPTNRVNRSSGDGYANHDVPGGSNAELIQKAAPGAKVVKAFNIIGNPYFVDPSFSDGEPTMLIAGNDADAKRTVSDLLADFGWSDIVDIGAIDGSRELEAICIAWVKIGGVRDAWDHGFKLLVG